MQPGDVPAFRGAARDGRVQGPALNQDWSARPPVELWRTSVGAGYASMVIVEDSLITLEQRKKQGHHLAKPPPGNSAGFTPTRRFMKPWGGWAPIDPHD
ncbi:MAG: hypothetical protein R3C12_09990 [Planctomycetaceae bacterium]